MLNLSELNDEALHANYRAYYAEIQRRADLERIPQELSNLAQQGREIGVADSVMVEAITRAPEETPAGEEL